MKTPFYVLYDGNCGMCRRTMNFLLALDFLHRLTPVNARERREVEKQGLGRLGDETLMKDMHAVQGDKTWLGYDAYRAIAGRVPLLWPVWPFLWLWPVTHFGRRIYRRVADTRSCELPGIKA